MPGLMQGKRGLVMGVANERSIAWGIAKALADEGAALAFSHQGEAFGRRVEPLAASVGSDLLIDVDVADAESMDQGFQRIAQDWGTLDFVVHAIAFADKDELAADFRFRDTSLGNFTRALQISCWSFIDVCRRASAMMPDGGSIMTLTFEGSQRVMPCYNVMGVAKAGLETAVRYLAADHVLVLHRRRPPRLGDDARGRVDHDADLRGLAAGDALLQRHGRR